MNALNQVLTSPYFIAAGVPGLLLVLGAAWIRQDFFLGLDLALTSVASGLIYLYEVLQPGGAAAGRSTVVMSAAAVNKLLAGSGYLGVSLVVMMIIMALHQDREPRTMEPMRQIFWLGGIANLAGGLLLSYFILYVKGV